jgi:acetylglutamate kinase
MMVPDKDKAEAWIDIGQVGEIESIDPGIVHLLDSADFIPVVAPIGTGQDGQTYNINADTVAGAIAGAMKATRLVLLTDVPGVLDRNGSLMSKLSVAEVRALIADGTVAGGMIPKLETCIAALEQGVDGVVILDGRVPHVILLELFTEHGAGTLIR